MSFGAMYRASTGMLALGTGMQTISNNLANVNTVGFKAMRTNYEDLISQAYFSGGKLSQVGCGGKVMSIQTIFNQGAFRGGGHDTDLAIAGEGFFNVRHKFSGEIMYTRAGVYTLDKSGFLEDPNGNILQGWQMSIPQPGQNAVRFGNPVDIQIAGLTIPPVATTIVNQVVNLNADDKPSYIYPAHELGDLYAAKEAQREAELAQIAAQKEVWDPILADGSGAHNPVTVGPPLPPDSNLSLLASNNLSFNELLVRKFNDIYGTTFDPADAENIINTQMQIMVAPSPPLDRTLGQMTQTEFDELVTQITDDIEFMAQSKGEDVYVETYKSTYETIYNDISNQNPSWQWEGDGFAGAWDANKQPPMPIGSYSHSEPMYVYDPAGNRQTLMVYYQKNPHMNNVWDYIVTSDPKGDVRLDANGQMLLNNKSSFAGLIQKGKITFSALNEPQPFGGQIKDIEAQNFTVGTSMAARTDAPNPLPGASVPMQGATIGGYYTGSPTIDGASGQYQAAPRTYTVTWGFKNQETGLWQDNNNANPPMSGLTWEDDLG
ncbi:MAG: flagellar hook-basal body complex protein, partial [Candidatus Adiutrix sp.]